MCRGVEGIEVFVDTMQARSVFHVADVVLPSPQSEALRDFLDIYTLHTSSRQRMYSLLARHPHLTVVLVRFVATCASPLWHQRDNMRLVSGDSRRGSGSHLG